MSELKRRSAETLIGVTNNNIGSSVNQQHCISAIKYKHPRLLMGGLRVGKDSAKRLVIEFPNTDPGPWTMEAAHTADAHHHPSSCHGDGYSEYAISPVTAGSDILEEDFEYTEKSLAKIKPLSDCSELPPSERYCKLVSCAKDSLATDELLLDTGDAQSTHRLCSYRLDHLTEILQQGVEVDRQELVNNLKYSKAALDKIYKQERRGSDQNNTNPSLRRGLVDADDELNEVGPDAIPTEVREWLAVTFTKKAASMPRVRGEKLKFKSVANAIRAGIMVDKIYRTSTSMSPDHHKAPPDEVTQIFKDLDKWNFDIWELNKVSENRSLRYIGFEVIQRQELITKLKVGYSKFNNPYHNLIHGADVTQTIYYLLHQSKLTSWVTDLEILAVIVASLIHDYEHTGTSNNFHIMTGSRLARLYNDKSVLENHHVSAAFELMRSDERNIVSGLKRDQYTAFRALVIEMVLATDMSNHFTQINNMKALLSCPTNIEKSKSKVLCLVLHAADIAHPSKPWKIHRPWTDKLMEEFFKQGDIEKRLGLSFSPMCDRNSTHVEESQIGFINFIVQPTMSILSDVLQWIPEICVQTESSTAKKKQLEKPWEEHLIINRKKWAELAAKVVDENKNTLTNIKDTSPVKKPSSDYQEGASTNKTETCPMKQELLSPT